MAKSPNELLKLKSNRTASSESARIPIAARAFYFAEHWLHLASVTTPCTGMPAMGNVVSPSMSVRVVEQGIGIEETLEAVVNRIPAPQDTADQPLRALIFDSHYDSYKVCFKFHRYSPCRNIQILVQPSAIGLCMICFLLEVVMQLCRPVMPCMVGRLASAWGGHMISQAMHDGGPLFLLLGATMH